MKLTIVALIVASLISVPQTSEAFGLMRYVFDMAANQLGLDRGPIPKVIPNNPPPDVATSKGPVVPQHPNPNKIYIQAEGF